MSYVLSETFREQNALDIQLYEFALEVLWPRQVQQYGTKRLENDLSDAFPRRGPSVAARLRQGSYRIHREIVYKPALRLQRAFRLGHGSRTLPV